MMEEVDGTKTQAVMMCRYRCCSSLEYAFPKWVPMDNKMTSMSNRQMLGM